MPEPKFKTYDVMKSAPPGSLTAWTRVFRGTVVECRHYIEQNGLAYREMRDNHIFVDPKPKTYQLGELFTVQELVQAQHIYDTDRPNFHRRVTDAIVTPALPRINEKTGQENDAGYLTYALEHVFNTHPKG